MADCEATTRQFLLDPETLEVGEIEAGSGARSALSPDGRFVASQTDRTVTQDDEEVGLISNIVLRDVTDGEIVRTMSGLCEWVDGDEWGPDSEWGKSCVPFPDTPFPDWPWDLAFSPDGSMLAMSGQNTPAVVVWDTSTGEIIGTPSPPRVVDHEWVMNAAFSPDADRLVASVGSELWMFSTEDWGEVGQYLAPPSGVTPVDNLLFTPDGKTVIGVPFSYFGTGDIVFMDGATLEHLDQIPSAHPGGVNDLTVNQDGNLLASAGVDGFVRVWDVATRSLLHQIPVSPGAEVGGAAFVGDTQHLLVTALETGELRKVTIDTEELLGIARERITRGFTETECTTYRIDPCPTLEEIREG
jgi:WD40 repeat protein